jgi:hypothetical protein
LNKSSEFENIPPDLMWGDKAVREIIRDFFVQSPLDENKGRIYGEANAITKDGCLALARKGVLVWNAWRKAFPVCDIDGNNFVDFSCHDFSSEQTIFTDFEFGDHANFSHAVFAPGSLFNRSKFGRLCRFIGTRWDHSCTFNNASFGEYAYFQGAQFGFNTTFNETEFSNFTDFFGTQFGENIEFLGAKFYGYINFSASDWDQIKVIAKWNEDQYKKAEKFSQTQRSAPDRFLSIKFNGSKFLAKSDGKKSDIDFSGRKFVGKLDFTSYYEEPVTFNSVPKFYGCEYLQNIQFEDGSFPKATGNKDAEDAYRILKHAFSEQHAVREEQRFFRLEMAEECKSHLVRLKQLLKSFYQNLVIPPQIKNS